jgi:hypothetical protein
MQVHDPYDSEVAARQRAPIPLERVLPRHHPVVA